MSIEDHECKERYHTTPQDNNDKVYCSNCDSLVIKEGTRCPCCNSRIIKKKQYDMLKTVLNNAVTAYEPLIIFWIKNPTTNRISIFQKWKYVTYEIPLSTIALYYDTIESGKKALPLWIIKIFTEKEISDIETDKYGFINKRLRVIGFF